MIGESNQRASGDRAVFLDRDGTIIEYVPYLSDPELVRLIPGAGQSLKTLANSGFRLVVITNQSGIQRGLYSESDYEAVNARLAELLREFGVVLDLFVFCPHLPDDRCDCRKPEPGLGFLTAAELGLSLSSSFMIGDNRSDIKFGRAIGATTILVETGLGLEHRNHCAEICDFVIPSLKDAPSIILGEMQQ